MKALKTVLFLGGMLYLLSAIGFYGNSSTGVTHKDSSSYSDPEVKRPSSLKISSDPFQKKVKNRSSWLYKEATITPLAHFVITAKAVKIAHYTNDIGAKISPLDFVMAWGAVSNDSVLSRLSISQSNRFYRYRYQRAPLPNKTINDHMANMHLVPANDQILSQLKQVKEGQVITLAGYLISIQQADGSYLKSSLVRDDSGAGACEVIWVESVEL